MRYFVNGQNPTPSSGALLEDGDIVELPSFYGVHFRRNSKKFYFSIFTAVIPASQQRAAMRALPKCYCSGIGGRNPNHPLHGNRRMASGPGISLFALLCHPGGPKMQRIRREKGDCL
jgi:hypothetical protein